MQRKSMPATINITSMGLEALDMAEREYEFGQRDQGRLRAVWIGFGAIAP